MAFSTTEKVNNADKLAQQIIGTANAAPGAQFWYNEAFGWAPVTPPNKLWDAFNSIPGATNPTEADSAVTSNPTILEKRKVRLTLRLESNDRAYLARQTFGDNTSDTYENWIQPSLVQYQGGASNGYIVRLYHGDPDAAGVEITTTQHGGTDGSPAWLWNYSFGLLLVSTDQRSTFRSYYDTNGLWLVGYRYIGPFIVSGADAAPNHVGFTDLAQVDVTHNLGYRPIVQVLEKAVGGLFGTDEGFGISFGSSDIHRELEPVHVEVHHLSVNKFRILLDNYYTGEIVYF
jgi:hypothetical protein